MKPRRVYPVVVRWTQPPASGARAVTVRLQAGGAQVVPAEQPLDAGRPDAEALFYVTPLTDGWIRGQRLDVLVQGQRVESVPLASRVIGHRWTWIFLFLALALPLLLSAVRSAEPDLARKMIETHVPPLAEPIRQNLPVAQGWWDAGWSWIGVCYADLHRATHEHSIVFTTFGTCLLLAIWAAVRHRQRRTTRTGRPVTVV